MDETPLSANRQNSDSAARGRHRSIQHSVTPSPQASIFVHAWLLAAVSVAIFLAAGPVQGSLGIFLVAAGVALTFFPARSHVGWPLWVALGGLLTCSSLAFLPAHWFPLPPWRTALGAAPDIHLASTVTPVPWETGFWLAILGLSCLTGLLLLAHPLRSRTVLWLAASAVVVCGVYTALSIYARQSGWHYPFTGGATFGFFPNRNHTATFLVTGSIASLGVLTIALREGRWTLGTVTGAAVAVCVAGLFFYSGSRGGVVFLVIGTLIWVAGLGGTHRNLPLLVSVVALVLAAGVLFLVSGGEARTRLLGTGEPKTPERKIDVADSDRRKTVDSLPGSEHDTPVDFRFLIWRDTLDLIKDAPLTGTGLGEFAPVFAEYRHASLFTAAAIHPESDWLMLTAEAGLPAFISGLVAVGLLMSRLRGARQHPFWPLRWGCVAAAATAVLHGVVDVPAHRIALGWWILVLAGLGFQSWRSQNEKSPLAQRILFFLGGLGALILGIQLIRAEWFGGRPLPPFAASVAQARILATFERGDYTLAMEQARQAVETSPMAAPLYYQWGATMLHFEDSDREVDDAFKAQRLLNPAWPSVPLQQGDAWASFDPKKAADLWLEALDRQIRIDHAPVKFPGLAVGMYRNLLQRARPYPPIQRELVRGIERGPEYLLAWLDGTPAEVIHEQLPGIAARPELLASLTPTQRERWLVLWYSKGERAGLTRFLDENPAWQQSSWLVDLYRFVDERQFEQATRVASAHYKVSLALPSQATSAADTSTEGSRAARFSAAWIAGNTAAARRTLDEPAGEAVSSPITGEDWRLRAALAADDRDWPRAWENLKNSIRASQPTEALP